MKTCTLCKKKKQKKSFNKKNTTKDGLQNVCRECNRARSRQYYNDNKDLHKKNTYKNRKRHQDKIYAFINRYKRICSCFFCRENNSVCLDFHHKNGADKEYNIGNLCSQTTSLDKVKSEIRKCVVLCSNCHRKLHAGFLPDSF